MDIKKVREALKDIHDNEFYDMTEKMEIVNEAITELERLQKKEVAMIVDYKTFSKYDNWFSCPNCNSVVKRLDYYCSSCGQKLDWSDEK